MNRTGAGMVRWLLVRRSRRDGELAFDAGYGLAATPLVGLVQVAGIRWAVGEGFVLAWSRWRRRHQARARRAHDQRRG